MYFLRDFRAKSSSTRMVILFNMRHFAALSIFAPLVAAHGFVQNATIGGKEYDVLFSLVYS